MCGGDLCVLGGERFPAWWETAEEGLERFGFFFGFCSLLIEKLNLALKNERD